MDFEELRTEEEDHNIEDELIQCGFVFVSYNEKIVINCDFCDTSCTDLLKFVMHVKSDHFESHDTKLLENETNLNQDNDNSSIQLKSEPNAVDYKSDDDNDLLQLNDDAVQHNIKREICVNNEHIDIDLNILNTENKIEHSVDCNTSEEKSIHQNSSDELNLEKPKRRRRKCNADPNLFCNFCKRNFSSKERMEKHKSFCEYDQNRAKLASSNDLENKESKKNTNSVFAQSHNIHPFICRYCGRKFKNRSSRVEHECLHTGEKLNQCEICAKRFRLQTTLRDHVLSVHKGVKSHKCHLCDAAFGLEVNLQVHIRRHLGEKRHKCNYCDKSFVSSTEKRSHERIHTGEKPYQCNECGQCLTSQAILRDHLKRHAGLKTVKCTSCDKYFVTRKAMFKHAKTHSNLKPHKCQTCDAAFITSTGLKQHEKIHSNMKGYICKICGKGFKQRPGLYCHMKSHKEI